MGGMISDAMGPPTEQQGAAPAAPVTQNAAPQPDQGAAPAPQKSNSPDRSLDDWKKKVVDAAATILYDNKSGDSFSKSYSSGDPAEAIARTTVSLITSIDDKLNGAVPEEVILPAALEVMDRIAELHETETGQKLTDQQMQQASANLVKGLMQEYGTTQQQAQEFINKQDKGDIQKARQMFGGG